MFWEPLCLNTIINLYRFATPSARTPDEHPLLPRDFRIYNEYFSDIDIKFYGLSTLAAVPMRDTKVGKTSFKILSGVDSAIFMLPGLKYLAWYSLITCTK